MKAERIMQIRYPIYRCNVLVEIYEALVNGKWEILQIRTIHDDNVHNTPYIVKKRWKQL